MTLSVLVLAAAFIPMALEARRSRANERALRALGAREPEDDVYGVMQVTYPLCFAAMAVEAWLQRRAVNDVFVAGAGVFLAGKLLKYWAIAALGPRWTFRVLVPPRSSRVASGPYRFMRHPNYAGVAGELAGAALMAQAPITGITSMLVFGALMVVRIRVEERALGLVVR